MADPTPATIVASVLLRGMEEPDILEYCGSRARGTDEARVREAILAEDDPLQLAERVQRFVGKADLSDLARKAGIVVEGRTRRQLAVEWLAAIGVRVVPSPIGPLSLLGRWEECNSQFARMEYEDIIRNGQRSGGIAEIVGKILERMVKELIVFGAAVLGRDVLSETVFNAIEKLPGSRLPADHGSEDWALRWVFKQTLGPLNTALGIAAKRARGSAELEIVERLLRRRELFPRDAVGELQSICTRRNTPMHDQPLMSDEDWYQHYQELIGGGLGLFQRLSLAGFLPEVVIPVQEQRDAWGCHYVAIDEARSRRRLLECPIPLPLHRPCYLVAHNNPSHIDYFVTSRPSEFDTKV